MSQPMSTSQGEMTDEQYDQALAELLAGLSDDELEHIGALAEEMHDEGAES